VNQALIESFGPPPFLFHPASATVLKGPAFSVAFKLLASAVVFGTAAWFVMLELAGKVPGGTVSIRSWFLAALAMMLYTWWCVIRSETRLDSRQLHQTWVWDKKMELRELAFGKLIRIPGLDWLVAPRLYVRTLTGKFAVFYAADPRMIAEFQRLVAELKAFRGTRQTP
jgi:hypothetical protein